MLTQNYIQVSDTLYQIIGLRDKREDHWFSYDAVNTEMNIRVYLDINCGYSIRTYLNGNK